MTTRVWAREELDRVHPMRDGFEWRIGEDGQPFAAIVRPGGRWHFACGMRDGYLSIRWDQTPADVVLAVILAAKGLDSYETMAAEMERRAADAQARASVGGGFSDCIHAARADGQQREAVHAAAMLRRGTVQP